MNQDFDYAALWQVAAQQAARILTRSGGHEVEDVAQRAMKDFSVYASAHEVDNPGGLVRVIAHRRALKVRDAWERRRRKLDVDDPRLEIADPLDEAARVDLSLELGELLSVLSPTDLRIVELRLAGWPVAEIATELGRAPQTIRNRLVMINQQLRLAIEDSP